MTRFKQLFTELQADFDPGEIKVLTAKKDKNGNGLRYATARTFMNRLDSVLGPENWTDDYILLSDNSVLCRLTVTLPDGTKVTKADAGGMAGMKDEGDDDKSGFSDAFKRACVKFGVGRHLYNDGMPTLRDAPSGPSVVQMAMRSDIGTAVPEVAGRILRAAEEAEASTPIVPEPEPAGLSGEVMSFWDYLNDEVLKANLAYRHETGDGNGCVDVKGAVKSVVDMTHRAGKHRHDPSVKRTVKQWQAIVNEIADASEENREYLAEYLRSHINIATETATIEAKKGKR